MSVKRLSKHFIFIFLLAINSLVMAQPLQDVTQLELAASNWLDQELSKEPGKYEARFSNLDPRLRLARCTTPLVIDVHGDKELRGRVSLKVSCLDQNWFVYLSADIARYINVVVARTDLPRRANLTTSMLQLAEINVARVRGDYYTSFADLQGVQLRNRLRAGDIVTSNNLLVTDAVNRGEQISIVATNGTLSVRMSGEALDSGKVGDQVRVRNLQSGRVIRALVVGRGKVEVRY